MDGIIFDLFNHVFNLKGKYHENIYDDVFILSPYIQYSL
jgi:hypothetical protein